MSIETGLKPIETSAGFQKVTYSNSSNLNNNKLLYTYAEKRKTSTPYGNLFKSFNFPITSTEKAEYLSKYSQTALRFLDVEKIIVVEIPKGEYGELIDGKTFKLTIPVILNSVETATTVYGTYFGYEGNPSVNTFLGNKLNKRLSEINENYFGFKPTADNDYNTNVTFLYSNDIARPKDKGDVVTVLTSTTVTVSGDASNRYTFTTVTISSNEIIYLEVPNAQNFNDVVIDVGGFNIPKNVWTPISLAGIYGENPTAYITSPNPAQNPKQITVTIRKQQSTNTLAWNVWSPTNKFPNVMGDEGGKIYASFNGVLAGNQSYPDYDEPVGILFQDKGFAVITNPTLVDNFRYTAGTSTGYNGIPSGNSYTSGVDFAKIYFTDTNISNCQFDSITTEFVQNIICIASAGEFVSTTNSTFEGAYDDNATERPVFITSIGLYNEAGELIGIGKLSEPVKKLPTTVVPFNIRLVV